MEKANLQNGMEPKTPATVSFGGSLNKTTTTYYNGRRTFPVSRLLEAGHMLHSPHDKESNYRSQAVSAIRQARDTYGPALRSDR